MSVQVQRLVKNAAMALLARCEQSRAQLTRKLEAKGYQGGDIMIALDALEADNYLSETRFVNCMIRFRAGCGMGPVKIMSELQYKHQIAKAMIIQSESWMAMDWLAIAQDVYNKKYGENPSQQSKNKVTQLRFLQQRGFTNDQIYKVIKL